ncbi:DNA cytosine methyltransferase [Microbacterium arborescens]|uniref:DNA cytosine methyltransferase n=1 Tax=Microbacterium arborescens TaxID=33883 RepID=UPI000DF78E42|nr:DNA cytosine methyltransferase [Microbacterium arborescens]
MNAMLSGELFAGVGGLGMAVDEVFGTRPAWFCEFDAAPSKVLAYRYPLVPNYGDVTKVDFTQVPHTTVRAGGFPCQDVSLAGRRRGMQGGTRSGLWSEFARSIEEDRPDWVVIENVRGLLSADASGDMEPCPLCVGDNPEHVLRALGAVLGDLAELGFDAEWTGIRASDVGAPHGRFRVFILAWPAENTGRGGSGGRATRPEPTRRDDAALGSDPRGDGGRADRDLTLLPTPVAQPSGNTPDEHLRKKPGREVVTDLAIIAENGLIGSGGRLLPTPRTTDMNGAGVHGDGGLDLRTTVTLLPTPTVGNATGGNAQRGGSRADEKLLPGLIREHETDWGPYAAAIARWEAVTGRPVPAPVRRDGKGGKPRLNPELTEWMMGWPAGWVTDPAIGLSRSEQLKACGNGVVPQQAAAALRELLARPGVPPIRDAVRREYEKEPALTPFSRTPMSFELAAALGTRSHAAAQRRAETPIPEDRSES